MASSYLIQRAQIIGAIREFFNGQGFIETDTPTLVLSPGMEPHIRPLQVADSGGAFLHTSPEFAMKKIMARGYHKIFQICKCYRHEPKSDTHNPEFTMIEWYRGHAGYEDIMQDVENLFSFIAKKMGQSEKKFQRISIEECFSRFAGKNLVSMLPLAGASDLEKEKFNDDFFRVFLNDIEPALKNLGVPVIVFDYPESQAALSNLKKDPRGILWAKRFEVYAGGNELGNAFDELIDSKEQRKRFIKDQTVRKALYGDTYPESPIDEEFLSAIEKMPPSGGIAMGVDRIVMYFTGAQKIQDVLWEKSFWHK